MSDNQGSSTKQQYEISEMALADIYSIKNKLEISSRRSSEVSFDPNQHIPAHSMNLIMESETTNFLSQNHLKKRIGIRLQTHPNGAYKLPDLLAVQAESYGVDLNALAGSKGPKPKIRDAYDQDDHVYSITATAPLRSETETLIVLEKWFKTFPLNSDQSNRFKLINSFAKTQHFERFIAIDSDKQEKVFYDIYEMPPTYNEKSIRSLWKFFTLTVIPQEHALTLHKLLNHQNKLVAVWEYAPFTLQDLLKSLKNSVISEKLLLYIMRSLVKTVVSFHMSNVLIHSLDSSNVFFTENGLVKISLLTGLHQLTSDKSKRFIEKDSVPYILPPEAIGVKNKPISIDYYSLAVIMYQLIFKRVPYDNLLPYERMLTSQCTALPEIIAPFLSKKCVEFYQQLSQYSEAGRASDTVVMSHPWLESIDFDVFEVKNELADLLKN